MNIADTHLGNSKARRRVIDYYDHCRNDYRVLWRTDENASIHFGFFDDGVTGSLGRSGTLARTLWWLLSILAAGAAGCLALLPFSFGREAAIRCLRVAAAGRSSRHDAAQHRMTAVCAEMVAPREGERVLDSGCGLGGTDIWLASRFGAHVFGINVQHQQLVLAKRLAEKRSQPRGRVHFFVQDYTVMGMADDSFDVVWGLESICHCEDKSAFAREAFRVLRRGGRLMVADFFLSQEGISDRDAARMRAWTEGWAIPNLASVNGFQACLTMCGFSNIRYRDIRRHAMPSSRRLHKASLVAEPIHWILERAGLRSAIQGANVRAARLQYETLRDGLWTYGIVVAEK